MTARWRVALIASVILGVLVVGYVSAGVARARPARMFLAWVVLVGVLGGLTGPVDDGTQVRISGAAR